MRRDDFDYYLPQELIAQRPLMPRDSSGLLILHRHRKQIEHRKFHQIIEFLKKGDLLRLYRIRQLKYNDLRKIAKRNNIKSKRKKVLQDGLFHKNT